MTFTEAEYYLINSDPKLGAIIQANGTISRAQRQDYFTSLCSSIIGQQISVKAAAKILERFRSATHMEPQKVLDLNEETTKLIGLSGQKSRYLHDLAKHFVRDSAIFNHLDSLSDEDVITELTKIKGIGVWTAQMFLMFTLVRPDIFAPDDRGLQLGIEKLHDLEETPTRSEIEEIAKKWAPYRTTASWHLWQSLNNTPQ